MPKSKILTTIITLIASTSLCKATCPSQRDIKDQNIRELSRNGQTTIDGKVYKMIGENKTGNRYNNKLLNTHGDLHDFLERTKFDKGATIRPTGSIVGVVSVQTPEGFCAYNISVGSVGETSAVIALSTNPDQVGVVPPRPSRSSPSVPPRPSTKAPEKF